jgi:hypothetical protein
MLLQHQLQAQGYQPLLDIFLLVHPLRLYQLTYIINQRLHHCICMLQPRGNRDYFSKK